MADPWTEWYTGVAAEGERNRQKRAAEGVNPNDPWANLAWSLGMWQPPVNPRPGSPNYPTDYELPTRRVSTVPVDPATGMPATGTPARSIIPPNSNPVRLSRMGFPQPEPIDVYVPGTGEPFGTGYQSGYVPGGDYRLLPGQLPNGAVAATERLATATPDMRGMSFNPRSRDSVTQRVAGLGFVPPPLPSLTADTGFMQPEVDPWAGMRSPAENDRMARRGQQQQQQQTAQAGSRPNLLTLLLGGLLGGGGQQQGGGLLGMLGGGTTITPQGGGGAFVNSNPQPNTPLAAFDQNALLPASMNTSRWRTGY